MSLSLPFQLKQKPLPNYFEHGVIRFSIKKGKLFFTSKQITKKSSSILNHLTEVKDKEDLDKLLNIKSINELSIFLNTVEANGQ